VAGTHVIADGKFDRRASRGRARDLCTCLLWPTTGTTSSRVVAQGARVG
jgi:predicted kinase